MRHQKWFCNHFSPFLPVLHCPLGLAELQACPFPDVVFFLCPPCLLPPFTVPRKMVLARPDERETWPYHRSLRLFTIVRRSSCGSLACWILARTSSSVTWSLYEMCSILRWHLISMINRTLTWTTSSVTCVYDLCACVYIHAGPRFIVSSEGLCLVQSLHRSRLQGNSRKAWHVAVTHPWGDHARPCLTMVFESGCSTWAPPTPHLFQNKSLTISTIMMTKFWCQRQQGSTKNDPLLNETISVTKTLTRWWLNESWSSLEGIWLNDSETS